MDDGVFRAVLESTPVSCYFQEANADLEFFKQIQLKSGDIEQKNQFLNELEECKQKVFACYFKHLVQFCQKCGGNTWEAMRKVLTFEADQTTIMLRLNTLGRSMGNRLQELYPHFGELYPFIQDNFQNAQDYDSVVNMLNDFQEYRQCLE